MRLGGGVHLVHTRVGQSLIVEGPPLTLIDTGRPGSLPRISSALRRIGKSVVDIEQVVITHAHHDHIGSAAEVRTASGAKVMIHHADRAVATGEAPPYLLGDRGIAAKVTSPFRETLVAWTSFPPVEIERVFDDQEEIRPGLKVIATPGHSPGHVSILLEAIELLHVGDALWNVVRLKPAPLMFNLDYAQAMSSVVKLAELKGYRRATFGHGPPILKRARRRIDRAGR